MRIYYTKKNARGGMMSSLAELDRSNVVDVDLGSAEFKANAHRTMFFIQAEDGIRVHCVTGVQTCAFRSVPAEGNDEVRSSSRRAASGSYFVVSFGRYRAEERRVGKESKNQWCKYN